MLTLDLRNPFGHSGFAIFPVDNPLLPFGGDIVPVFCQFQIQGAKFRVARSFRLRATFLCQLTIFSNALHGPGPRASKRVS